MHATRKRSILLASLAALALSVSPAVISAGTTTLLGTTAAFAQDNEGGNGGNGSQNQGGQGQGDKGSQTGQSNQGGEGSGQGGPGIDSDAKGPNAGDPAATGGGKPVWSQEGIPEVELGRLNIARSPDAVIDRAYTEAITSVSPDMVDFYNLTLDEMVIQLSTNFDNVVFIDSPLQNLALLEDALDGTSSLTSVGVTTDTETLMALFLGVAADKGEPWITADTVIAVTTILGTPITGTAAEALAADALEIQIAIVAGHG